jgi:hypothetical protein
MIKTFGLTVGLTVALSGAALGQEAAPAARPACAAMDQSLPPALAGWTSRTDLGAAAKEADAAKASVPIGKGVNGQLVHTSEVAFPVLPEKPGGSVSYSGLYEIRITDAGNYQVSLSTPAWIDMVSGKAFVESSAHAPGPACSTLKKTVVFPLKPGRYVLEISGNGEQVLPFMVTHAAP